MDSAQILLIIVVMILTAILTLVGVEVFFILRELRQTVEKTNKIIDDSGLITASIAKPIAGFSGFLLGLKDSAKMVKILAEHFGEDLKGEKKGKNA